MLDSVHKLIDYARAANRRRLYRRRGRRLAHLQQMDVQQRFEYIYDSNYWGSGESKSGNGSTLESTALLRPQLESLLRDLNVKVFLDAPCGDWNWMQYVKLPEGLRYVGGDIVPTMIEQLKMKYASAQVEFRHLNLTDEVPRADLWLCRDCLFHLSYADIMRVMRNFVASGTPYALLTSMPDVTVNADIMTGSYRPLNLLAKPFGFPEPRKVIDDGVEKKRYLGLWHRDDIAPLLKE